MGRLTAILFSSDYTLCVLNRNPAFCCIHEYNKYNHCNKQNQYQQRFKEIPRRIRNCHFVQFSRHGGETCQNTSKQQHGDTVSDSLVIDSISHPYNDGSTRNEAHYDYESNEDIRCGRTAVVDSTHLIFQCHIICIRHESR